MITYLDGCTNAVVTLQTKRDSYVDDRTGETIDVIGDLTFKIKVVVNTNNPIFISEVDIEMPEEFNLIFQGEPSAYYDSETNMVVVAESGS